MWSARQVGIIIAYAAIPLLLVVGSVALAVTEGAPAPKATRMAAGIPASATRRPALTETPQPTSTTASTPTTVVTTRPHASPTASPSLMPPTPSPRATTQTSGASPAPAPATATAGASSPPLARQGPSCGPFLGWSRTYVVRPGDTLFQIALRYRTSVWQLRQANCKDSTAVFPGERLCVPAFKTSQWEDRPVPPFHWNWWERFPWYVRPGSPPDP
jgi:hypothetical protein